MSYTPLACVTLIAKTDNKGNKTAVTKKPKVATSQFAPAICPK